MGPRSVYETARMRHSLPGGSRLHGRAASRRGMAEAGMSNGWRIRRLPRAPVAATRAATARVDERPGIADRWVTCGDLRYHYRVAKSDCGRATPLVPVHGLG